MPLQHQAMHPVLLKKSFNFAKSIKLEYTTTYMEEKSTGIITAG